jgi:hypothetical protein
MIGSRAQFWLAVHELAPLGELELSPDFHEKLSPS